MRRLFLVMLLMASPAMADDFPLSAELPRCVPAIAGRAMCRDGMAFECHEVGASTTRTASGWLWEANILLPCDANPAPADLPYDHRNDLPPSFSYAPQFDSSQSSSQRSPGGQYPNSQPYAQPQRPNYRQRQGH
jgi:hypothetical protein